MRWYVNRTGQTVGPLDEANIMHWAETGQITRGMSFQAETGGPWLPVEHSPFARFVAASQMAAPAKRNGTPVWVWALIGVWGLIILGVVFSKGGDTSKSRLQSSPEQQARTTPSEPVRARECILRVPGRDGTVLVFPTEEGYDEFGTAAARSESDEVLKAISVANGGFMVDAGTRCSMVDAGLLSSRVRVVEGPSEGRSGWVPNEWHRGN
jgi:hypothetical protein